MKRIIGTTVVALVLLVLLAFFVLPALWLLLAPTKTAAELTGQSPLSFGSFANIGLAWQHLTGFENGVLFVWLRNSAVYAVGALIVTLVTSIPAGYALALTRFRGRKLLLTVTLIVMIMPSAALVLPVFLELNLVHLIGTAWSIILPFSFYPFGVYLVYIYFATSLPRELLSAARLDGASEWQIFTRIALPLATPVVGLVAFFSFVGNWNNFFLPYLVLPGSDEFPIQVGLNQLLSSTPSFNPVAGAGLNITSPELALAIIVAVLPVLVLFLFSQRTLVSGMLAGATKE
ncbi:carbohydrate ABC transporter permease [Kutzneria kofuensis]|uniref:Multiple sugar transport system permease protein n=1 Tax=Kutzneria kofuensis TaxID=103725 RepID=A0A7W9KPD3_9PSEU|nr:carbohydrate ABC transporter permease [Kutzneria kofuensis]MBB5895983.1 multiple sugar transport system permease protein [Kutzneria kofuensis]